jgi:hypothetical protein
MKSSLVMLAVLPLALLIAGCEGPPEADDVGAPAEVSGAQTISRPPIGPGIPINTRQFTATIDFDNAPAGAVGDGSVVDATYAGTGVTLSCVVCASTHAYAILSGISGNNAVSLWTPPSVPEFDARAGAVKAAFNTPRSSVSIDATAVLPAEFMGTPVARPFLEAFDAAGHLVGSVVYYPFSFGTAGFGTTQTLTVTSSTANIAYVLFSSQAPGGTPPVYGLFDNLRYNISYFELLTGTI